MIRVLDGTREVWHFRCDAVGQIIADHLLINPICSMLIDTLTLQYSQMICGCDERRIVIKTSPMKIRLRQKNYVYERKNIHLKTSFRRA